MAQGLREEAGTQGEAGATWEGFLEQFIAASLKDRPHLTPAPAHTTGEEQGRYE